MHRRTALAAATLVGVAVPASASASTLTTTTFAPVGAKARTCHAKLLPTGTPGVRQVRAAMDATGVVRATSTGVGDWDLAIFDERTGRVVGAGGSPDAVELAEGFAAGGDRLVVQACRFGGDRGELRVTVAATPLPADGRTEAWQIVRVDTPTPADKQRLLALGFDETHSGGPRALDVLIHGADDAARLSTAGFTYTVREADLLQRERERIVADARYALRTKRSALPSGRTEYRRLADYETEMKQLAAENPGLVKLITLPDKSLEGRDVLGLEIASNVNRNDGKPAFVQLGVHHAREWPAGEHPMEWAYELIRGYGKDQRVTSLVDATRNIVVPIVNPDGFNLSREAPVDTGNATATFNLPDGVNRELPIEDPAYIATLLADQFAGTYAYKRRNCRIKDGEVPQPGECSARENRTLGVDPNRNYGALWGGPGAGFTPDDDTYRGAGPFSEPETQNVKHLVSSVHATTLITNHTFSNLILRPPGVRAQGASPDEAIFKELSDAMAGQNGYASIPGYQLYDTTGTTEDWSYNATGGLGYTFEIGEREFHPPFEMQVGYYEGTGEFAGKGNRGAYFLALENTANAARHSVLTGRAPEGTRLRLTKSFLSETSPVISPEGAEGPIQQFEDKLDTTLDVGDGGAFEWHVNPSTRPPAQRPRTTSGVASTPASSQDISSSTPPLPRMPTFVEIDVPAEASRLIKAQTTGTAPADDIDIYLYEGTEPKAENQVSSSAGGTADELISYGYAKPGKYLLEIRNFAAVGPYDGKIELFAADPGTEKTIPAQKESWTMTCERPSGTVLATRKVEIDRGETKALGAVCRDERLIGVTGSSGSSGDFAIAARITRRNLPLARRVGIPLRVRCSTACRFTAALTVDRRTARRLGLSRRATVVASGRATKTSRGLKRVQLRFTKKALRRLARARSVKLRLVVLASNARGTRKAQRVMTFRLRR